jgi:hypothetical protein
MLSKPPRNCAGPAFFAARARRLGALPIERLVALAAPVLDYPEVGDFRRRLFSPPATFWLFLSQVLGPARACREAVRKAQAWIAQGDVSPSTSAYCQARARLPQARLDEAFDSLAGQLRQYAGGLWMERRVNVVDGTTLSMPDTPENQNSYPQSARQLPGCGFPIMRLVAIFSLASGAIIDVAKGSLHVAERTLWHGLWHLLEEGSVVVADRGFCGFADYCMLRKRGVDAVMRLHARRTAGARKIARLGKADHLMEWEKTGRCPKWMTKKEWRALPKVLRVRHIELRIDIAGFRTRAITIATTILDPKAYPAECFADLYRRRWMAELFLRDIKITMGMDILRCKTPNLIHKELAMHLIAYNLVRALMLHAAVRHDADPLRLSLAGALAAIREWAPALGTERSKKKRANMLKRFLQCMARDTVPCRPNRSEPRARKRRSKNYQLLNKPRSQFKEIQHRNRYEKPLS